MAKLSKVSLQDAIYTVSYRFDVMLEAPLKYDPKGEFSLALNNIDNITYNNNNNSGFLTCLLSTSDDNLPN